jgi:O-antigen/teichoic acid export membrane protein/glycosyltransferase involved in cell wall biosynthesis
MQGYKYLFKNIGLLTLSQFGTKILVFFLVPLYTSVLSTAEYGTYDLFNTTINLLVPIVTLNLSDAVLLFALDKTKKRSEVLSIGLKYAVIGFCLSTLFLIVNAVLNIFTLINEYWYYFPFLLIFTVINALFSGFVRGIDRVKETAIGGVICSASMISCNLFFLLVLKWGLHGYFIANIISLFLQIAYLFVSCELWKYIRANINKSLEKEMKDYSTPLIANNVGWWVNSSSDRYIVTWMCGVSANGIYSVGYKIPSILNMFQSIFSQAWTMSAIKDFDSDDSKGFFSKMYSVYNCGMVIVCSGIIITSRLLAHILYAKEFFVAWQYVPFLTIAIVFGSLAGFLGGIFAAAKDSKLFGKSTIIGAVINIILNIILVYFMGAIGAAIATLVAFFIVWFIRLRHVQKHISIKINLKRDYFSYLVLTIQGFILFIFNDGLILYSIEGALFMLIVLLNYKDLKNILEKVLLKFKTRGVNMENIKVSLIVAIYKSEKFLPKLIESITNQTYKNIEIILVDDGSPDNSGAICDQYAEKDIRIKVIHKKNGGACEARNTGLNNATGEYVAIIDGDDWLELDFVDYLLNIAVKTKSDMVLSDKIFTTRDREQTINDKIEIWSPAQAATAIIYPKMEIGPWNKLYRLQMLKDNNITFSVPWSGEGLYFASTAAQCANQVGVGHKKIYNYRLNNANSGLTNFKLEMALNAAWNIQNIKDNLKIHTPELVEACDYHICRNQNFIIFLIVATNSMEANRGKYQECKKNMLKLLPGRLIHSDISFKKKLGMIRTTLFPVYMAKRAIKKNREALANDKME